MGSKWLSNFHKTIIGFNPLLGWRFLLQLVENFGWPFFLLNTSMYIGVKGALFNYSIQVELPYYRDVARLDGSVYQKNSAISYLPFSLKSTVGVISDLFPLMGYRKTSYLCIFTILGILGIMALILVPAEVSHNYTWIPMLLFFCVNLEVGGNDLLIQAKYVEQMKKRPNTKANIVTYSWFCCILGGLIPSFSVGFIVHYYEVPIIFFIMLPFAIQPLFFILTGGVIEDKVPKEEANKINIDQWKREWKPMTIAFCIGFLTFGTIIASIFGSSTFQMLYSFGAASLLIFLTYICLMNVIARALTYKFLSQVLYVNILGALEYYYLADNTCAPNGPHFDYLFFRVWVSSAGLLAQLIGLVLFQVLMSTWKFRPAFWFTTVIRIIGSVFDIIVVNGWHRALHIPDHLMYLLGNSILYQASYMLDNLPGVILTAKLCPKGIEATMFAILSGITNYGVTIAGLIGVFLMEQFNIQTIPDKINGIQCNFDNLTILIVISHLILPAISIPLTFFLIPDSYISDNLVDSPEALNYYDLSFKNHLAKRRNKLDTNSTKEYTTTSNSSI